MQSVAALCVCNWLFRCCVSTSIIGNLIELADGRWAPNKLLFSWYPALSRGCSGRGMNLTTHFHIVPKLRKSGPLPLLPYIRTAIRFTNGCNSLFCVFISFFTLHVSGSHEPIISGIPSCFLYTTIWFMQCLCCSSACACGLVCHGGFTVLSETSMTNQSTGTYR
jgi:hypothetical protein